MSKSTIYSVVVGLLVAAGGQVGYADSDVGVGGPATAELDFQISIPTILYLQVGSPGAGNVDLVTFPLTDLPGTGSVPASSPAVDVLVAGILSNGGTMVLDADSSNPLSGGGGTIPFSDISWAATAPFTSSAFTGGPLVQPLDTFIGSGARNGTYTFSFANDTYYPAGTYLGTVIYTLSSP